MAIIFTPVNKTWAIVNNRISLSDIPADWQLKGTLLRNCGCIEPERFSFYLLPNGQVAEVMFHPMNGPDDLFVRCGSATDQRNHWNELLAGEPWEQRTSIAAGLIDHQRGRRAKAYKG